MGAVFDRGYPTIRRRRFLIALGLVSLAIGSVGRAENARGWKSEPAEQDTAGSFAALRRSVPALAAESAGPIHEVTIHWVADAGSEALRSANERRPVNFLTAVGVREAAGSIPLQRNPELSETLLVAVAIDESERELGWHLIPDPRVVRAEFPGPTGELEGEVLYRAETEFLLALPSRAGIRAVRLFQPQWNGESFDLELLGTCELAR